MIVLDTNVVSEVMKPSPDARAGQWFAKLSNIPVATTIITVAEIIYGLQRLPAGRRRSGLEARFDALISPQGGLVVLAADRFAAHEAGRFRALREGIGLDATPSDMMIAGIVASTGATLATRNTSDFTHLPIKVVDPWQPA